MRKWRREGGDGREYKEKKREYARLCEEKRKKEVERWVREVEGVRTEGQVWKVVNRGRKRRGRVNEGIAMGEWDGYFRGLLGGGGVEGEKGWGDEKEGGWRGRYREGGNRKSDKESKGWEGREGGMGFRTRCGNMEARKWRIGYGGCVRECGGGKAGHKGGERGWWCQ